MLRQRTLKNMVSATGVGIHSGKTVNLRLRPAPVNTGIVFCRVDLDPIVEIKATAANVVDTRMCTVLGKDNVSIATVEHLMASLAAFGIDNAYIDVDAPEIPIMDGSSAPFVLLIQSVGIAEQSALKRYIRIVKPVKIEEEDKWAELKPHHGFYVDFTLEYDHPCFNNLPQQSSFNFSTTNFIKAISRSRTFGFVADFEKLQKNNLALGASLDNVIAIDKYRILNHDGLRYDDEFVKHKVLDAIGDMYLAGANLIGQFTGYKSGHSLNNQILRKLLADQTAWEEVTFEEPEQVPVGYQTKPVMV